MLFLRLLHAHQSKKAIQTKNGGDNHESVFQKTYRRDKEQECNEDYFGSFNISPFHRNGDSYLF